MLSAMCATTFAIKLKTLLLSPPYIERKNGKDD
jgi:hypothetical protein